MIWINGERCEDGEAKISIFDHGLLYGDGIFEGIRIYCGRAFRLDEHIDRLYASAKAILLAVPWDITDFVSQIEAMVQEDGRKEGYIRLLITRGVGPLGIDPTECGEPGIIVIISGISLYPDSCYQEGIPIITAGTRRNRVGSLDPRIKSLNYLNNVLAKIEARQACCREALMLTEEGLVSECTGDNIVAIRGDELLTPNASTGALAGITLDTALMLARDQGFAVRFADLTRYDLYTADEVFLTGTACEIMPVTAIDGRVIGDGRPGRVTACLMNQFTHYVRSSAAAVTA